MVSHIVVVGFHHKLGCQVEFSYPPLPGTNGKNECPKGWKYFPTLALPDGSHNFSEDTVYFNLPSLIEPAESYYGISCYRQIPVEKLKNRTEDMTRSSVQKSVCILAKLPIYGYIEVKLALIADAFFEQGDFSSTELLTKAYQQLNACLDDNCPRPLRHFYVGLPLREIVLSWKHKTLILFKLLLLQKRVICFGSPVRRMCQLIISIASLIPRLMEKGFQEVACVRTSRPLSPMPDFKQQVSSALERESLETMGGEDNSNLNDAVTDHVESETLVADDVDSSSADDITQPSQSQSLTVCSEGGPNDSLTREASVDNLISTLSIYSAINPDEYRQPLSIFANGNLCLPYLSLPFMDLLSDISVQSYVIGTSNILFQQKRQLADVLVDIENIHLDIHDAELRKQLVLSTEDLRFMDYLLKNVQSPKEDAEGSELWIREQFQGYLLALLNTSVMNESSSCKDIDQFNNHFMQAFRHTLCFQEWYDVRPDNEFFSALPAGHPFAAGSLSVSDVKLKIAQSMQNSESGRKINQAVNSVGGAISQAKGAFSSWWSNITTQSQVGGTISNVVLPEQPQEISVTFHNNEMNPKAECTAKFKTIGQKFGEGDVVVVNTSSSSETEEVKPEANTVLRKGIVEIGKEAELLDKTTTDQLSSIECAKQMMESEGTNDENSMESSTPPNNDIFIV